MFSSVLSFLRRPDEQATVVGNVTPTPMDAETQTAIEPVLPRNVGGCDNCGVVRARVQVPIVPVRWQFTR